MDWSSWFRRKLLSNKTQIPDRSTQSSNLKHNNEKQQQEEEQLYGITEQLIEHVKTLTLDTFKNFPLQDLEGELVGGDDDGPTTSRHVKQDLSEWQEKHATFVLTKVKEIAQLRYMLCPRHLKERQFWKIYFMLVKNYVAEYELRAIRLEKLRKMASEEEKLSDTTVYEVEMSETKQAAGLSSSTP